MTSQYKLIRTIKWDNLIILDTCRYDYFKQEHDQFLEGKLVKALSPGTSTPEWLTKTWGGYYDLTYISSTPVINSFGVPRCSYVAQKHFKKIIDVWDFGWNEELGTVPPWNVNKTVLNLPVKKNLIIHYMQPHEPYMGKTKLIFSNIKLTAKPAHIDHYKIFEKLRRSGKVTFDLVRKAYMDNLRLVLDWVAKLTPSLEGKVVITADHGELLGENGKIWHPYGFDHPKLREVPWFEMKAK